MHEYSLVRALLDRVKSEGWSISISTDADAARQAVDQNPVSLVLADAGAIPRNPRQEFGGDVEGEPLEEAEQRGEVVRCP